ncbi:MAG TPA: DUF983 domain-containing protein [Thermoleophilia bacterium]|nr:DUF983 domain-containing protein [Thermoleophilia bacterium]
MTPPQTKPSRRRMLFRGVVRRCPLCGSGDLFQHWTKMRERCPSCGHRFERKAEEGFFLGAFVINFVIVEAVLGIIAAVYIAALSGGGNVSVWPYVGSAAGAAVLVPLLTYPNSKTIWAAIDLVLHPPEVAEEAEAILHRSTR